MNGWTLCIVRLHLLVLDDAVELLCRSTASLVITDHEQTNYVNTILSKTIDYRSN